MNRSLTIELVRVTEAAAIASSKLMGRGDEKSADQAAVDAMRQALNKLSIHGRVVIGEGERDEAPMLYIGEKVGNKTGPNVDIALDPLEGTTITAQGGQNALSVVAMAGQNGFLHAPDVYMDKIAIGPGLPPNTVDLDLPILENLSRLAKAKSISIENLAVCVLNRPRHEKMIEQIRQAGARIYLINDGDVSGVIATATPDSGIDMYVGQGGAPEGVLAAAALQCTGGHMQGRLVFRNQDEIDRAKRCGIDDLDKKYNLNDLACQDVIFSATGVTSGAMLSGVRYFPGGVKTHSVVMRSKTKTVRTIDTCHYFEHHKQTETTSA